MVIDLIEHSFNGVIFFTEKLRYCVREEHVVHHAGGQTQDEWIFHYNDGTEESIRGSWK